MAIHRMKLEAPSAMPKCSACQHEFRLTVWIKPPFPELFVSCRDQKTSLRYVQPARRCPLRAPMWPGV
jgi:hypothetical protein